MTTDAAGGDSAGGMSFGGRKAQMFPRLTSATGAVPSTHWLQGCIALNEKGFVRTGSDLVAADFAGAGGAPVRSPQSFETNCPEIFAVGDVRCGSVKRVAAAVGEGSAWVHQVHQALHA